MRKKTIISETASCTNVYRVLQVGECLHDSITLDGICKTIPTVAMPLVAKGATGAM